MKALSLVEQCVVIIIVTNVTLCQIIPESLTYRVSKNTHTLQGVSKHTSFT